MEQPRQRDADRSRAAILDAAESLFAEHGYDAVTMAQVGAAAGVSRGTPGYFFGSKEALHQVVVGRAAATMRMLAETLRVRDAVGGRTPAERVSQTVDAFLSLLTSRASLVRLIDRADGAVAGEPHAEALRDALEGLGPDRDRAALVALAMCWFPISHPGAARLLGVDPDAPGFAETWRTEVLSAIGLSGRAAAPVAVAGTGRESVRAKPAPVIAQDPAPTTPVAPDDSPHDGSVPKKKKKKRKKKSP